MGDFAASAMLRLIARGLAQHGLSVADVQLDARALRQRALVALEDKRALLAAIERRHGATLLLRLGEAVHGVDDEPAVLALCCACEPIDLVQRWQRLERFVHTRHRIVLERADALRLHLRHVAVRDDDAPWVAEDALVFGLLTALLARIGCTGLRARFAGEARWRLGEAGWREQPLPGDTQRFEIEWHGLDPRTATPAARHDGWVAQARATMATDPARGWTVALLAARLGLATRSLQRALAAEGVGFSALLQELRTAQACRLLTGTARAVSEIGYSCGYADQAHFTREFKRLTALTPLRYREQFAQRPACG
jgi:AraC-like DNA-binding protein